MKIGDLPIYLDPIIGRQAEIFRVRDLLDRADVRLVTLTGVGGVGKTRIAVHVLAHRAGETSDSQAFVDFAPVDDPALFAATIAQALDISDPGDSPLLDRISTALRDRRFLLLLDNLERVTSAGAELSQLLRRCPSLRVLATSRVPLRLQGEYEVPIRPFTTPKPARAPSLEELATNEAVSLFLERARAVEPHLSLSAENAGYVAEICRRVNGIPLALELAAARANILHLPVLAGELELALPLLVGGRRDAPARHQTMRDAISWSFEILSERTAQLFPQLAIFIGTWSVQAASDVIEAARESDGSPSPSPGSVMDAVLELAEHGLIRNTPRPDDVAGFTMLEVVREFGLELLEAAGRTADLRSAHAAHFLAFAEQSALGLAGPEQSDWMARLRAQYEDIRAAMSWAVKSGDAETALRLGGALWPYWARIGKLSEGRLWLERALTLGPAEATPALAKVVHCLGNLAIDVADYRQAEARFEESLALYRELGNPIGVAAAQTGLGLTAAARGQYGLAREWHEACLFHWRTVDDRRREAFTLHNLGDLANAEGNHSEASDFHRQALAIQRSFEDMGGVAFSTLSLAEAASDGGDLLTAASLFAQSLKLFEQIGDDLGISYVHSGLGRLAHRQGEFQKAAGHYKITLAMRQEFGDRSGLAECAEGMAAIAVATGDMERAGILLAAASVAREALGSVRSAGAGRIFDDALSTVVDTLEPSRLESVWAVGHVWSQDEMCAAAAQVTGEPSVRAMEMQAGASPEIEELAVADPYGLSPREREILRLLGRRMTDKEIADALFISQHTVHRHVTNVLVKLNVSNRREAAAVATKAGLL